MLFACGIFKLNMKSFYMCLSMCLSLPLSLSVSPCQDRQFPFIFHLIKQQHQFWAASPLLMLLLVLFAFISRTFQ